MQRRAATLLASLALAAPACDDAPVAPTPPASTARFAQASEPQRARALLAASGADALVAENVTRLLELLPTGGCPAVTRNGSTVTIEGRRCSQGSDGPMYLGRAVLSNLPRLDPATGASPQGDPTQPMQLRFEEFAATGGASDAISDGFRFDGTIWQSPADADGAYTRRIDLTATLQGIRAHTYATLACDATTCTPASDSWTTVDGIGSAMILGSFAATLDAPPAGWIQLDGADSLELDYRQTVDGCTPYRINQAPAGALCNDPAPDTESSTDPAQRAG